MSEWVNCPKCGTLIENLCACSNPKCADYVAIAGVPPPAEFFFIHFAERGCWTLQHGPGFIAEFPNYKKEIDHATAKAWADRVLSALHAAQVGAPSKNSEWNGFYARAGVAIHLVGVLIARFGLDPDAATTKQVEAELLSRLDERNALIMAVARKFDGETRFETALRYIRDAEERATSGAPASEAEPKTGE